MDVISGVYETLGPLLTTLLLGITSLVLFFWYTASKQSYWKKIGIPYAEPIPFLGSLLENVSKPLHDTEYDRYMKLGKIYGHYEGNRPVLSVADPDILRNILVKDFHVFPNRRYFSVGDIMVENMLSNLRGEDWKRVRTIITPTFTTGKIKRMMNIFKECSETVVKNFEKASKKGEPVDAKILYGAFSMDIIASSAFSTKIDSHNDPNNEFVTSARASFSRKFNWRFFLFLLSPRLMKLFKITIASPMALKFFSSATVQIIEERKRTGQTRNDFLQLLMDTAEEAAREGKLDLNEKDDIAENYGKIDSTQELKPQYLKKSLSHIELVANCVIFFLAGYDTTASTLSFASYCLALNPDIQEKLIKEIDEALRANGGELTYEALQSMKYLDKVISETLRIYPPGVRLEREAQEDYKLGDTGLTVPKGMLITIPVYALHRDPKLFPDPEKFDPERFSPEERAKRNIYTYLPFGAGPRNCVAMRFALIEVKVCLAHVLSNFRIKRCSRTKVPLEFLLAKPVLQPTDIVLLMEKRKDAVKAL